MEPYRDSLEHLTDELRRIDLFIRRAMLIARFEPADAAQEFRGLVISEQEIDDLLGGEDFLSQRFRKQSLLHNKLLPLDRKIEELRQAIDARRKGTESTGRRLTLPCLAERFAISPAEVDLLLLAIAPELEPRYETLYAYLQDDATRKRLSVDLALNLICRSERERMVARRIFAPESPLIHFRMVELHDETQDRQPTLLRKFLRIEDSLLRFLLEQPPASLLLGTFISPAVSIDALEVGTATRSKLRNLAESLARTGTAATIVRIEGNEQSELESTAEALGDELRRPLLSVSLAELQNTPASVPVLVRDAELLGANVAIFASEPIPSAQDAKPTARPCSELWRALADLSGPILALGPASALPEFPADFTTWNIQLPQPDFALRKRAWESALNGTVEDADHAQLAETFRFGVMRIRQATVLARSLAALREPANPVPSFEDVLAAGRSIGSPNLQRFAVAIEPRYGWNDIVLSDDRREQLEHIAARVEFRGMVHRDWGFGEKLSRGKGLNVLFTGPSGVGKTMAAEVLANALSLTLFQIDLSSVVSKYIGETEAHLSAIFREAESAQCLLFFDEADSLFGKRTEVKDAHDRYANLEVNYLLQRIEQYDGIVVLATNFQRNLDDAFLRRMHEVIDFPLPDEVQREMIWRRHLPADAPVEPDIDFAFLARQFKLTGGYIKNAVMTAAFLAAPNSKKIGMEEMIRAVKIELQKQGKLVMKSDFGRFFETVQRARVEDVA
jgi:hypothetical protein